MVRFGVCRREQFALRPNLLQLLLHGRRVSYQLLRTSVPPTANEVAVFDNIVYYMKRSSGIYASTAPGRFQDLDATITRSLERLFAPDRALMVEDWGASDAVTSAEWFQVLRARFPHVGMIASDLTVHLVEATIDNDGTYVLDPDGHPLQYVIPPLVIRFPEPMSLVLNRWIAARALRKLQRLALRAGVDLAHVQFGHPDEEIRRAPFVFRRLSLTHPHARALSRRDPAFQVTQHSVFEVSHRGPDVIRTMNVLNRDYFAEARLSDAARAVWTSLNAGGVWIVGRTLTESPRVHRASILRKTDMGFELIARHQDQSDVEGLALAFAP
jgi:nucleotide-binding universal stress UspA family protein